MMNTKACLFLLAATGFLSFQSTASATQLFMADLTGDQVVPPTGSTRTGTATLVLNDAETQLAYTLSLVGFDLDGLQTPGTTDDDVTAIHIHQAPFGTNGPHALNVFGVPREDDADMTFDPVAGTVSGIWDDGDENFTGPGGTKIGPDSQGLTASLGLLKAGNLYFQIHTNEFSSGDVRGQIAAVTPEPSTAVMAVLGLCSLCWSGFRRRNRA